MPTLTAAAAHAVAMSCPEYGHLTYAQATTVGLLQGVTEPFPVSSLGHTVLVPGWMGWHNLVCAQSANESFYLAFVVGLHVASALALLVYFWRDWVRIIGAFFRSIWRRKIETPTERLAWLIVIATIPAGIMGLALEHFFRTLFAKPLSAAIFLTINGLILFAGERYRRRAAVQELAVRKGEVSDQGDEPLLRTGRDAPVETTGPRRRLDSLAFGEAVIVGVAQVAALFAGISRSGITMVTGLVRGLDHEDAARFSFLLATPIILAAGVLKFSDLTGPLGAGDRTQILVGSACTFVLAIASVAFLLRWFRSRTLWPFGVYCLAAGLASIVRFA